MSIPTPEEHPQPQSGWPPPTVLPVGLTTSTSVYRSFPTPAPTPEGFSLTAPPKRKARSSAWAPVAATAVLSALLASGGTYAVVKNTVPSPSVQQTLQAQEVMRESKVIGATEWTNVIQQVNKSVVSIQVILADATSGAGSGVVLSADGLIATNNHVVSNATSIRVGLQDGRLIDATVVGRDATTDVAVIKLATTPEGLTPVPLANSDEVLSGDEVLVIGNPLGLTQTSTTGIVSALDRPTTTEQDGGSELAIVNAIQIDASVNPGNSGGPVFNAKGEVIGLASSIAKVSGGLDTTAGSIGIGFAIPANVVKSISDQLIATGKAEHGKLGATVDTASATTAGGTYAGARIREIVPGSAADSAGLRADDVVVSFNGKPITSSPALTGAVRVTKPGTEVTLGVVRGGAVQETPLVLKAN